MRSASPGPRRGSARASGCARRSVPTGAEEEIDEAGNQWFTLPGSSERALLLGGHIDSVPNGGWLDGCLNVVAAVEVLRRIAEEGTPPLTVRLVNWADEEGARFGRSLFGSSAAAGSMSDQDELRARRDADGIALPDALAEHGVDLDHALEARSRLDNAAAYLELHIEQGPVLESLDLPLGVVLGTFGVERHQITFRGQAAHSGSTPMDQRRDALAGAAKLELEIREIAMRVGGGAVCTMGGVVTKPGIVTSVVETAECVLDQRHLDATWLAEMLSNAEAASRKFAHEEGLEVDWEKIWSIEPIPFDDRLIELADESIREVSGFVAPPAVGAAPRRRRGRAGGNPDRDAVRSVPAWALAHEARGHEGRAPRALGAGPRQADHEGIGGIRMSFPFGDEHVQVYRETDGEEGHSWREGSTILLLTTKGRKTGQDRTVPLIYDLDGDKPVIVASKGGAPDHPGWFKNLVQTPEAEVQILDRHVPVRAREAEGEERARLWEQMNRMWPHYDEYQEKTERRIPVVVLEPA